MSQIITKADVNAVLAVGGTRLQLAPGAIVTTLAREYAASKGVELAASSAEPASSAPSANDVRKAVLARLGSAPEGLDAAIAKVLGH